MLHRPVAAAPAPEAQVVRRPAPEAEAAPETDRPEAVVARAVAQAAGLCRERAPPLLSDRMAFG